MSAPRFEIDPRLLGCCDSMRRAELDAVVGELNAGASAFRPVGELTNHTVTRLRLVIRSSRAASIEAWGADEAIALGHCHVPWSTLRVAFSDYHDIIERIAEGGYVEGVRAGHHDAKFEALDHGKRLVHNDAAETLAEILEDFVELDDIAARSLFTLLFLIRTELPPHVIRYHRAHFHAD